MNERELKLLIEAGAVKLILITAQGSMFHVEAKTAGAAKVLMTGRGDVRQWRSIDSCARWLRKTGVGKADLDFQNWHIGQGEIHI
ncbi:hypothetical protein RPW65_16690 [Pseudomonas sp. NyZ704]|nr:hypothetical protein RPW65_16690 [Pseudomonas sp. NyZ704]